MQEPDTLSAPRPPRRVPQRASPLGRAGTFAVDGVLLAMVIAIHAPIALWNSPYPLDAAVAAAPLWMALAAALAVAYSWFFAIFGGRTPGMALAGQRLQMLHGGSPTPVAALARALLSVVSAAGLFGFVLALFDRRAQTLHDKLCRCVVIVD